MPDTLTQTDDGLERSGLPIEHIKSAPLEGRYQEFVAGERYSRRRPGVAARMDERRLHTLLGFIARDDRPAVIGAGRNQIDLIESGLTVFGDEQLTLSIPCQTLRIAMAKGIHQRALKRIVFGNATGKRQAENFSGETLEILRALVIFGPPRRDIEMVVRTDGDAAAIV